MELLKKIVIFFILLVAAWSSGSFVLAEEKAAPEKSDTTTESTPSDKEIAEWMEYHSRSYKVEVLKGKPPFTVSIYDSGGAHCCLDVNVSGPGGHGVTYSSIDYGLDGDVMFEDIDKDGTIELLQNDTTFHYYNGLSFVESPQIYVIFAYDKKRKCFLPAHRKFPQVWGKTLEEARSGKPPKDIIPDLSTAKDYDEFLATRGRESQAIVKAVDLILAGYEKEAYRWLKRQFVPEEGKRVCKVLREHMKYDLHSYMKMNFSKKYESLICPQ